MKTTLTRCTAIAAAVAGLALAGCSQADRDAAKAKTDQAVVDVKEKAAEMKADAKQQMAETKADVKQATAEMKADIKDATADAKSGTSGAMDKAKVAVSDATITASVKTELAKDDTLKARDINVDTESGRVSLRGNAPDAAAKDRATTLAQAVSGVVSVNNELRVGG